MLTRTPPRILRYASSRSHRGAISRGTHTVDIGPQLQRHQDCRVCSRRTDLMATNKGTKSKHLHEGPDAARGMLRRQQCIQVARAQLLLRPLTH